MAKPKDNTAARCAIYTRKSSEEGLEQNFNSLDAQREACEAFILSQKHEGWLALADMYDDGGFSGGTLERPALRRLLDDIETGRVDTVVVYKVDRLSRSLSDFAKIVDIFDEMGVSFVSVTQQFNTTTSMGRLTLNMLLSFAQFEREVTGERIRDKIAASKKKGMWMGGVPPLGYDVTDKKLVVNGNESKTVRHIFRRYCKLGSVRALQEDLGHDGIVSKRRVSKAGKISGGMPLLPGALYQILQNQIYRGLTVHKDQAYPGEHKAVVDDALWEKVQTLLADNKVTRRSQRQAPAISLLAGFIYDGHGERMTPTHANKKGARYRYYVSHSLIKPKGGKKSTTGRRLPAANIEDLVVGRIKAFLASEGDVFQGVEASVDDVIEQTALAGQAGELVERWPNLETADKRLILSCLVSRIDVQVETIDIAIWPHRIKDVCQLDIDRRRLAGLKNEGASTLTLIVTARLKRAGYETKLLIDSPAGPNRRDPDRSLLRLIAQAYRYREMVLNAQGRSMLELAEEARVGRPYFSRTVRLGFLAPDAIKAILQGKQCETLTARELAQRTKLPNAWDDQMAIIRPQ